MEIKKLFDSIRGNSAKMQFPENRDLVRELGADSMVLLKNNDILPINRGKVALFGAGAVDTIFCGTHHNYIYTDGNVNVRDGLFNAGFTFTTNVWLDKMDQVLKRANKEDKVLTKAMRVNDGISIHPKEIPISVADMAEAVLGTDICIYVLRRQVHPEGDRQYVENDYILSEDEMENIKLVASSFKKIILVLNCGMLELAGIARMKNIKGIIYMGMPGMEAGNSLADVLTGAVNPSAKLTDTWAKKYKDYPALISRGRKKKNTIDIDYKEGIYVGYRYFDTYDVTPLYPFGYGLSYTTFSMEATYFECNWIHLMLKVKVKNTGKHSGRQVVQLYCSSPEGNLDKPYQQLIAFVKTGKIKPNETEEVVVKVPIMCLCSYDDERSAWVMEGGEYLLRLGANSRDTFVAAKMVLDKTTIIKTVADVMAPNKGFEFMTPPERPVEDIGFVLTASLKSHDYNSENKVVKLKKDVVTYVPEGSNYMSFVNDNKYSIPHRTKEIIQYVKPCGTATYLDVIKGNVSKEEFIASLSPEVLARIVCGSMGEEERPFQEESRLRQKINFVKKDVPTTVNTTDQFVQSLGIPSVSFIDGPFGLHMPNIPTTCYPAPINMAQTWDMGAMNRMGRAYGREMEYYDIDYCLAPSLNIHRDPMWGRSAEFYSEDPVVSGMMGAGFIAGVKRYEGRNVIMKHMACYNQENNRLIMNINLSKRAYAEIYLRSFSVCQFINRPGGIMNSVNKINGIYASSQRGMNTDIVRTDWGFKGFVMTEWGTKSDKGLDLHAGCDLIMPGYDPDKILEAMMNVPPTFAADGYVEVVEKNYMRNRPMIQYEKWGSYILDKDGADILNTVVAPKVPLNERIAELEELGICQVREEPDGSRTIAYRCTNRGAYLSLGDLQQAVIHILTEIGNSAAMHSLLANT